MTSITNRYASAINSRRLVSDPDTTESDIDVLGAMGLAGKDTRHVIGKDGRLLEVPGHPLATALLRLLMGDAHQEGAIVRLLAPQLWSRAIEVRLKPKLRRVESEDMSRMVLRWCRNSACRTCHGHGYKVAVGVMGSSRAVIGDSPCDDCHGAGKVPFEPLFVRSRRDLALWLRDLIEREVAKAAPAAMKALAPMLDL